MRARLLRPTRYGVLTLLRGKVLAAAAFDAFSGVFDGALDANAAVFRSGGVDVGAESECEGVGVDARAVSTSTEVLAVNTLGC